MSTISRNQLVAEELLREHIRNRIEKNLGAKIIAENKIRTTVRKILSEVEAGTEEPSTYTGINVLADILEKIVPIIEDDYKMLTTSEEQRESFKNHIIHAVKNSLEPIEAATKAENLPEYLFLDKQRLAEALKIDLDPEEGDESVEGEFIDIDSDKEEDSFVKLTDQNETGRNFAATTFTKVEKQIVDAYDMLADEEDKKLFYDYLITNLLLYFDKFEDELQPQLPSVTTPEYEKEKTDDATAETETPDETAPAETETEAGMDDPFSD